MRYRMVLNHMKKIFLSLLSAAALFSVTKAQAPLSLPFNVIDTNYTGAEFRVPSNFKSKLLFSGNVNYVHNLKTGDSALSKQNHDYLYYLPINGSSSHGYIVVNHEITNAKNAILGDGGGMTVFEVKKDSKGDWGVVGKFKNVDFSKVGGTNVNCGGAHTPWGTALTAEEYPQGSNAGLFANGNGIQDTADWTIPAGNGMYSGSTIKKFENYGWMVEIDLASATGLRKLYSMGRFSHEGGWCMPDGKTVYLTDDFTPGVLFKFVANKANDYREGQLYAYKQGANGVGGSWITLPMDLNSLINIREVAISMGATTFIRLEWVLERNNKLYITETGIDNTGSVLKTAMNNGGGIANHHWTLTHNGDTTFTDYYGRVLELDLKTLTCRPYINGGTHSSGKWNFSNPDGLSVVKQNGKEYLVINEDLNGLSQNRMPAGATATVCEIYYVDLSIKNPSLNDLKLFGAGSKGAETTGGYFTPDGSTYFVNNQHPSGSNAAPWNNSGTIAITGFTIPQGNVIAQQHSVTPPLVKINNQIFNNSEAFGIVSSDDYLPSNPEFKFGGSADGMGILKNPDDKTYTMVVNHEDNFSVSRIVLDENLKPMSGEYLLNSNAGMWRLCSGTLATPAIHGFGPTFLTCGESGAESMTHAVPVFGQIYSDSISAVPNLTGFGRFSAENAVPLPKTTYSDKTVVIIGDDDSGPNGGQVAMYVGNRGDLKGGKLYILRRKDQNQIENQILANGTSYDVEFIEVPNHINLTGSQIDAYSNATIKCVRFGRVEDIDYRKGNAAAGREIYFNVTGQGGSTERTKWGRVYKLVLDANNPLVGKLECILDGDLTNANNPAISFMNPDNIVVTEDYLYTQEDPNGYPTTPTAEEPEAFMANKRHDARIYQYDLSTKALVVYAELDHRRSEVDSVKYNTNGNGLYSRSSFGSWEYGAMEDVSSLTGLNDAFLVCIQPHTWRGVEYRGVDGGTIRPNENQASQIVLLTNVPRIKAVAPQVNGANICSGEITKLTATGGSTFWETNGTSYRWYTAAQGGNAIFTGKVYNFAGINTTTLYVASIVNGKESATRTAVTVNVEQQPAKPVITRNGRVLTSSNDNGNQWYRNGKVIPGANGKTYTANEDGYYYVISSSSRGCQSTPSDELFLLTSSVEEIIADKVNVFPNPNDGSFVINFNVNQTSDVKITIVNMLGQIVYQEELQAFTGEFKEKVKLNNQAAGTYIVNVVAGDKVMNAKVQIQ